MTDDDKIGTLTDEALKRKERLAALKRKNEVSNEKLEPSKKLPTPKFRSYRPQDESLKEKILDDAKPGDVESEVAEQLKAATTKAVIEELDIHNLAPRKPDWDLKRDVDKKLEKLERRTQKAIAELIRDRLKMTQEDLASAVNVGTKTHDNGN
ncbi:coiled-coil domain-containing protein 12 [Leptopilina boulardi]|uniref:coiled-coil domain-containing protein 12 n=1 Tax=Leptopilina boulardi TaxID=63433 RepID=UPI0021F578A8|nr:coiled-coil domain-containing protein 12 [Leptopilina boulardi]